MALFPRTPRFVGSRPFVVGLALLVATVARAQSYTVSGTVFDVSDGSVLPSALVQLIDAGDSTQFQATLSDDHGHFTFRSVVVGSYRLRASYLGYAPVDVPLTVNTEVAGMELRMQAASTQLKTVEKVAVQPRVEQRGDTTVYNAAAYRLLPDATASDLLNKMPGIRKSEGGLTAQGEQVLKVLVDGEEFFGSNAIKALESLPAAIIGKVQVFDKKSDQAEFTGMDDGKSEKTLNIVTKKGMDHGVFGSASLGYGTDNRYQGSFSLSWFNGARRIGLMGNRDNTSQQWEAGLGGAGINTFSFIGLDFNDKFGKAKLSGDYYFIGQRSISASNSERTNYLGDTATQVTNSLNDRSSENFSHNLSFRIETRLDSSNSIILTPQLGIQQGTTDNSQASIVLNGDSTQLSSTDNHGTTGQNGWSFSNSLLFKHRFALPGRTFSVNLTTSLNSSAGKGTLLANNSFFLDTVGSGILINQRSTGDNASQNHELRICYTEPVGIHGQLQFTTSPAIKLSHASKLSHDIEPDTGLEGLNTAMSNQADNSIQNLAGGISYGYEGTAFTINIGLEGQSSTMHSEQTYPFSTIVDRYYANLLPNAMFIRRWSNTTNLQLSYRSSVSSPSLAQLQVVVDNRDPLHLTMGNLGLDQSYQHTLSLHFRTLDSTRTKPFFAVLILENQPGRISEVTYIPSTDSVLAGGTLLPLGSQLTLPKNLDGYVSARVYASYGIPISAIKCDLGLSTGNSMERLPGEVNGSRGLTWSNTWSARAELRSNFSEKVDCNVSYAANFNTARNDLRSSLNNSYFKGTLSDSFKLIAPKGWLLASEVNYEQYVGLGAAYDRKVPVWSAAIGHKFLKGDALEFNVTVNDILNRNVQVVRDVGDTWIQTTATNPLQRYVLFTLSYNLRDFNGDTGD